MAIERQYDEGGVIMSPCSSFVEMGGLFCTEFEHTLGLIGSFRSLIAEIETESGTYRMVQEVENHLLLLRDVIAGGELTDDDQRGIWDRYCEEAYRRLEAKQADEAVAA